MEIEKILPWQGSIWESLWQRVAQNRLPHALLFQGAEGVGKKQFANVLARAILCSSPSQEKRCGQCRACHLLNANTHPDLMWIEPEESSQVIKIEQIRQVVANASETAFLGGYRVIVISPASAMNLNAVNALLKTLEEPAPKTLLILISNQSLRLPATITSRCQKIIFPIPLREMALAWLTAQLEPTIEPNLLLNLAEGAPLRAKALLADGVLELRNALFTGLVQLSERQADPLQLAAKWSEKKSEPEQSIERILTWLLLWLRDLLRLKLTHDSENIINYDHRQQLANVMQIISQENLLCYIDHVQQAYTRMIHSTSLNRQLVLEELFIRWMQVC